MPDRPADPLTTIREALAIAWPEGDHAEPNIYTEALASLDAVERLVEAARAQPYMAPALWEALAVFPPKEAS